MLNEGRMISLDNQNTEYDFTNKSVEADLKFIQCPSLIIDNTIFQYDTREKNEIKTVTFYGGIFDNIQVKNENDSRVRRIVFENCNIKSIKFFKCDNISVVFKDSIIDTADIANSNFNCLEADNSKIDTLSIRTGGVHELIKITGGSTIETINIRNVKSIKEIKFHDCRVGLLHVNLLFDDLQLSGGALLDRLSIESKHDFDSFMKVLQSRKSRARIENFSVREAELKYQKKLVIAAFGQYEYECRYQELDTCLVYLRTINNEINLLRSKDNVAKKVGYFIQRTVLGTMFGWGVRISNCLITSLAIIVLFAGIYSPYLCKTMGIPNGIVTSLSTSITRFFNVETMEYLTILPHFDTLEQIIGVIMITIFTGIIARKIIK